MPLMYVLGFFHFTISYFVWKWLIFTFFRKSYNFDEMIPMYSVRLLKYAVLVHLLMIIFMYTNKRLLTPYVYDEKRHYRPPKEPGDRFFNRRYDIFTAKLVLWLSICIVIVYLIYKCID